MEDNVMVVEHRAAQYGSEEGMTANQVQYTGSPLVSGDVVTGRVVEVQNQSVFQTPSGKAVAFIFDRQPYQFGRQVLKSTIFVEPVDAYEDSNGVGNQRALIFNGDINGAIAKGHLVQATVRQRGGALYVRQLNNLTTSSRISATTQMGSGMALILCLLAIALSIFLLFLLVRALMDGSLLGALGALLWPIVSALLPIAIPCIGIYLLVKSVFR